jgi:hypothetical protein
LIYKFKKKKTQFTLDFYFFPHTLPFLNKNENFPPPKKNNKALRLYTYAGVKKQPPMHHTLDAVMTQLWLSPNSNDVGVSSW